MKPPKKRNPIAKAVRKLRPKVQADKKKASKAKTYYDTRSKDDGK